MLVELLCELSASTLTMLCTFLPVHCARPNPVKSNIAHVDIGGARSRGKGTGGGGRLVGGGVEGRGGGREEAEGDLSTVIVEDDSVDSPAPPSPPATAVADVFEVVVVVVVFIGVTAPVAAVAASALDAEAARAAAVAAANLNCSSSLCSMVHQ